MKATFALLPNSEVHNFVRKLTWEIHQKYRTGTRHAALPPYISLMQPFCISNLPTLERYMDQLVGSIQPFDINLTKLEAVPIFFDGMEYGLLCINIEENKPLQELHKRINRDLSLVFGCTKSDWDGGDYQFHMTLMMCGQLMDICRKYQNDFRFSDINLRFTAGELGMFVYDEPIGPHSDYICYKRLPFGGQ